MNRVLRDLSKAEMLKAAQAASLNKFNSANISPLEHVEKHPEDTGSPLDKPHACHVDGSVRDENNQPIQWPWSQSSGGASYSSAVSEAAIAAHIFNSTRTVRQRHRLDDMIELCLDKASSDGKRGRSHVGIRAWFAFCEDVMGVPADRPMDPATTPLWAKLEDEWLAMRFVCALVSDRGISPNSAYQYFCMVQGWHAREWGVKLAGGLKLERLPQMLKGMKRVVDATTKAPRKGVAPDKLRRAMDMLLDPANPKHANLRAALACALQGLLRSAEYTNKLGKTDKYTLMRSDLTELREDRAVVMMHPCKNNHHLSGKTCPLVIGGGGEHVDAVKELRNLMRVDPASQGGEASTPLFRDPDTNTPVRYDTINNLIKEMMVLVGEGAEGYSTHSLRIGGATALFAAGATETVIRTMGRWSSDIHRLYVRACFEQCCEWTRKAGSQMVTCVPDFVEVDDY